MQLNDTVYVLAEHGDKRANDVIFLSKGRNGVVFWWDKEDDINYGDFYLKTDNFEFDNLD